MEVLKCSIEGPPSHDFWLLPCPPPSCLLLFSSRTELLVVLSMYHVIFATLAPFLEGHPQKKKKSLANS